jgi:hypothetical protein
MKNPSPDTSRPDGRTAASGTTRTAVGTPFSKYNDPPSGTPATGTFTFTEFGIGSRFPTGDGDGDGVAVGDGTTTGSAPPPPPPLGTGGGGGTATHFANSVTLDDPITYEDPAAYTVPDPPELSVHPPNVNPDLANDPVFPSTVTDAPC